MAELSHRAKQLLKELRDLDEPSAAERSRADAAIRNMLEERGLSWPAPDAPIMSKPIAAHSGALTKLTWALVATVGIVGVWRAALHQDAAESAARALPPPASAQPTADTAPVRPDPPEAELLPPTDPKQPASPKRTAATRRRPAKPATTQDSLASELRLLSSVDADVRTGAYDRALRRLQEPRTTSSPLQEERAAMRVLALCGRDHDAQAARERERFLRAHPHSVLRARVLSACVGEPGR